MWTLPSSELERLLSEDVPAGDLTTRCLGIGAKPARMTFRARQGMTIAGIEIAADLLRLVGLTVDLQACSGERHDSGSTLLVAEGPAGATHAGWKQAQTLIEAMSGIASRTRQLVDAAEAIDRDVRIACTRKALPGVRRMSQLAVLAGGGIIHRTGLSETILVFPEHRCFLQGEAPRSLAVRLRKAAPEKKLVVEVATMSDAAEALEAGFDVVQLEKMTPEEVAEVAHRASVEPPRAVIAVAGGVNIKNVADYVRAGARLIVSSWPYAAPPSDVAVEIGPQSSARGGRVA